MTDITAAEPLVAPDAAVARARRAMSTMRSAVDTAADLLAEYSRVARSLVTQGAADYSATRLQDMALADATRLRNGLRQTADTIETAHAERERMLDLAEAAPFDATVAEELAMADAWDDVLEELRAEHTDVEGQIRLGLGPVVERAAAAGDRPTLLAVMRKAPRYARRAGIEVPIDVRERLVGLVGAPHAVEALAQRRSDDADAYDCKLLAGQLRGVAAPSGWSTPVLMRPGNRRAQVQFEARTGRIVADGMIEYDIEALEQMFGLALRAQTRQGAAT